MRIVHASKSIKFQIYQTNEMKNSYCLFMCKISGEYLSLAAILHIVWNFIKFGCRHSISNKKKSQWHKDQTFWADEEHLVSTQCSMVVTFYDWRDSVSFYRADEMKNIPNLHFMCVFAFEVAFCVLFFISHLLAIVSSIHVASPKYKRHNNPIV